MSATKELSLLTEKTSGRSPLFVTRTMFMPPSAEFNWTWVICVTAKAGVWAMITAATPPNSPLLN